MKSRHRHGTASRRAALLLSGAVGLGLGCNLVVGSYEFRGDGDGGGRGDAAGFDGARDAAPEGSCAVDLTEVCYPCAPETTEEFLNACGESACIPFDRARLEGLLLPDGGLPPLPPDASE